MLCILYVYTATCTCTLCACSFNQPQLIGLDQRDHTLSDIQVTLIGNVPLPVLLIKAFYIITPVHDSPVHTVV